MFSSGLPLLYPITAANLLVIFWVDKILCKFKFNLNHIVLRVYKKPLRFSPELSESIVTLFKYCLVMHFVLGLFMYSNLPIIPLSKYAELL